MKTLAVESKKVVSENSQSIFLEKQNQIPDLEVETPVFDYATGQIILSMYSSMLQADNYKLMVKNNRLKVVVSEHIELSKPLYLRHYSNQLYNQQSYDRYHSFSIKLSDRNNYLVRHEFDEGQGQLKVVLGCSSIN